MTWGQLLFSFRGRVGRSMYWLLLCVLFLLFGLLDCINVMSGEKAKPGVGVVDLVIALVGLLSLWPSLALTVKRWHDIDMSAWWVLTGFIPFVGGLVALICNGLMPGTPGTNRYGEPF